MFTYPSTNYRPACNFSVSSYRARARGCSQAKRKKKTATRKARDRYSRDARKLSDVNLRRVGKSAGRFSYHRPATGGEEEKNKCQSRKQEISPRMIKQFNRLAKGREEAAQHRDASRASKLIPFLCSRVIGSHR